jgi:Lipase (class 3)
VYVAGHSLGGAMAVLFGLIVGTHSQFRPIAERVRAIYTFGQPMTIAGALPRSAAPMQARIFRHVLTRDPVPCLPPAAWGPFAHVGREYRYAGGGWKRAEAPVAQLDSVHQISRSLVALFADDRLRSKFQYAAGEHAPHHYLDALRPCGRVSEFGDQADVVSRARAWTSTVGTGS